VGTAVTRGITVESRPDRPGIAVVDDVDGTTVRFDTPEPVVPVDEPTDDVTPPVDRLTRLATTAVRVPKFVNVIARDETGTVTAEARNRDRLRLSRGRYALELESLDVKTYLFVDGTVETYADDSGRVVAVSEGDDLRLGTRSRHQFPAATMTTTDDPTDVMCALSHLGSALKTRSPERSWPTLRGHPPLLERGEELHLPEAVRDDRDRPVTIRVPPRLDAVYPVASLAFYLDARVEPGRDPALVADGVVHPLDTPDFETCVDRTLRALFFLDCLTRTEGLYPFELAERDAVEELDLDLDFAALYDAPLGERTRRYLDVPFDAVADHLPRWKTTADVRPAPTSVEQLPFLVDDLATVRCPGSRGDPATTPTNRAVREFARGGPANRLGRRLMSDGGTTRAGTTGDQQTREDLPAIDRIVGLPTTDSVEHVWVGDGYRMGSAKPTVESRKRRLAATPSGPIDVAVVVNDPEMHAEGDVRDLYGLRELVRFDVTVYEELTRDELETLLAEERDFLHFVGHVDERGLQCADGYLDAAALDRVGTRAFMLNACRSYAQAHHLVDAGAIGGLATVENVENVAATGLGRTLARLLNAGFSLGGALDVLGSETRLGRQYLVVGDQNLAVAQCRSGLPVRMRVERTGEDRFDVTAYGYPTTDVNVGSVYAPTVGDDERRYLSGGRMVTSSLSGEEVAELFSLERLPVTLTHTEGVLWSDELNLDAV